MRRRRAAQRKRASRPLRDALKMNRPRRTEMNRRIPPTRRGASAPSAGHVKGNDKPNYNLGHVAAAVGHADAANINASITRHRLLIAHHATPHRSRDAPSLSPTSLATDHPRSPDHRSAFGCASTHLTVGQCIPVSPHHQKTTAMSSPPTVHRVQNPSGRRATSSIVVVDASRASGSVDGVSPVVEEARDGSASPRINASLSSSSCSFMRLSMGTPPRLLPTSSQKSSENFLEASRSVGVFGAASSPSRMGDSSRAAASATGEDVDEAVGRRGRRAFP
mmetsp:Transcript_14478/g.59070  ORF Transcript_14478/g.59070 Transcript_14478/m.59070 type:complete len:278 (-) Transcript_14478:132-965(-)